MSGKTVFFVEGAKCPKCGGSLVSDGNLVWCSFIVSAKACNYGIDKSIFLDELKRKD